MSFANLCKMYQEGGLCSPLLTGRSSTRGPEAAEQRSLLSPLGRKDSQEQREVDSFDINKKQIESVL